MARRSKSTKNLLLSLSDQWSAEIRDAFQASIADIVDNVILQQIIDALTIGDYDAAFRALGMSEGAFRPVTAAIERAFEAGGTAVGGTFPKQLRTNEGVRAVFRFNVRDSRAEKWIREESARLVTNIGEQTRVAIRNIGFEGMQAGQNPRKTALDIVGRFNPATKSREGGVVGLTPNQERWVSNFQKSLHDNSARYFNYELRNKSFDSVVRKAIENGKPLDAATIEKLTSRYKSNALRYRGEVIGRTEALNSLRASNREAYEQAVDMGAMKSSDVTRVWDATGDNRTREDHLIMDGQKVGMNEPFVAPDGSLLMYPGDTSLGAEAEQTIQCRCVERYEVNWYAGLK